MTATSGGFKGIWVAGPPIECLPPVGPHTLLTMTPYLGVATQRPHPYRQILEPSLTAAHLLEISSGFPCKTVVVVVTEKEEEVESCACAQRTKELRSRRDRRQIRWERTASRRLWRPQQSAPLDPRPRAQYLLPLLLSNNWRSSSSDAPQVLLQNTFKRFRM